MTSRSAARLAGLLWLVAVSGIVAVVTLALVAPPSGEQDFSNTSGFTFFLLACASIGALVASRQPANPIGWIFCITSLFGLAAGIVTVLDTGAFDATTIREGSFVEWVGNWIWTLAFAPLVLVLLLFPTGKPLSARWRVVVGAVIVGLTAATLSYAFAPGIFDNSDEPINNPYGVEALGGPLRALAGLGGLLIVAGLVSSMLSLVLRYRRSGGVERQQLKLLAFSAGVVVITFLVTLPLEAANQNDPRITDLLNSIFIVVVGGIPLAVGVAILRYRLYDIDRIISRTVAYAVLTVVLAAGYFGGVVLVQSTLPVADDSPLVVAASTLAMVALFRPLKDRVQGFVDRRFNRRRYDASRTIDAFGARLRAQTDLDDLSGDLVSLVKDTMQPAHASLWLRPTERTGA